jgi:hypothetical protein
MASVTSKGNGPLTHEFHRASDHPRADCPARPQARRVRAHPQADRPRAELHRARHLLGDVERALLVQILENPSAHAADQCAVGDPGTGRKRRCHRHRRRPRRRIQDGEPQPPELHRALPGRSDRRRRHLARRLHHGRPPDRLPQRAVLRRPAPSENAAPGFGCRRRDRRLRQFLRRAHGRRRSAFPSPLRRQLPGQRHGGGHRRERQDFLCQGDRRRHADRLSRLEDRARRHPRRHHGIGRVRRRCGGETPDRAGRRSVRREASARGLPRNHGRGLRHRHPGHGRGGPDLLGGRDGRQGRSRRCARPRQGALP